MPTTRKEILQAFVNALIMLISLWLIASPFVFGLPKGSAETTMNVVFGALIIIAYFCALLAYRLVWPSGINIVFGVLVLFSQQTQHYPPNATRDLNYTCVGAAVIVLACISALLAFSSKKAAAA